MQQLRREYSPERPRPKESTADGGEEAAALARDEFDMYSPVAATAVAAAMQSKRREEWGCDAEKVRAVRGGMAVRMTVRDTRVNMGKSVKDREGEIPFSQRMRRFYKRLGEVACAPARLHAAFSCFGYLAPSTPSCP